MDWNVQPFNTKELIKYISKSKRVVIFDFNKSKLLECLKMTDSNWRGIEKMGELSRAKSHGITTPFIPSASFKGIIYRLFALYCRFKGFILINNIKVLVKNKRVDFWILLL